MIDAVKSASRALDLDIFELIGMLDSTPTLVT